MLEQSNEIQETHEGTTPLHHCISPYLNSDISLIKTWQLSQTKTKKRETENLRHPKVRLNQSQRAKGFTGLDFALCNAGIFCVCLARSSVRPVWSLPDWKARTLIQRVVHIHGVIWIQAGNRSPPQGLQCFWERIGESREDSWQCGIDSREEYRRKEAEQQKREGEKG